jgi:hypothetical protein
MIYLIYYGNFLKCYNVPPSYKTIKNMKFKFFLKFIHTLSVRKGNLHGVPNVKWMERRISYDRKFAKEKYFKCLERKIS